MKPLHLLSLAVIFLLSSCGDDLKTENQSNIIGTWIAIQQTYQNCDLETDNTVVDLDCTAADCLQLFFEKDSIGNQFSMEQTISGVTIGQSGTFKVHSNGLTLCVQEEEDVQICSAYKLDVNQSLLTLSRTDTLLACTVVTLYQIKE